MKKKKTELPKEKENRAQVDVEENEDVNEPEIIGFPKDADFKKFLGCGG